MLKQNWNPDPESEFETEIAESGFLIIYDKPADSGFGFGLQSLDDHLNLKLGPTKMSYYSRSH